MSKHEFSGVLKQLIDRAVQGREEDVDHIFQLLNDSPTLAITRFVDYALSLVESDKGVSRILYYLHNGTQIQRNYCSLYFNRRGDWTIVKDAYDKGLIDEIQAFSR